MRTQSAYATTSSKPQGSMATARGEWWHRCAATNRSGHRPHTRTCPRISTPAPHGPSSNHRLTGTHGTGRRGAHAAKQRAHAHARVRPLHAMAVPSARQLRIRRQNKRRGNKSCAHWHRQLLVVTPTPYREVLPRSDHQILTDGHAARHHRRLVLRGDHLLPQGLPEWVWGVEGTRTTHVIGVMP